MILSRFELLTQIGAGGDGISYRARETATGQEAVVHLLTGSAVDAGRLKTLAKRLRLFTLLDHPAVLAVRELSVDHDPPHVVMEAVPDSNLGESLADRVPLPLPDALEIIHQLSTALAAAHRLGLAHGRLAPTTVYGGKDQQLHIDLTGLDTGSLSTREINLPGDSADPAADVLHLGALLVWLSTGNEVFAGYEPGDSARNCTRSDSLGSPNGEANDAVGRLLRDMLAADPAERPSAAQVAERSLAALHSVTAVAELGATGDLTATVAVHVGPAPARPVRADVFDRGQLGRFRLLDKLGEGGMGVVYRAEDLSDGAVVAIKVLQAEAARRPEALQRFHKEARLLAEINNPYVTNLLEVNEDDGIHYIVLEFVAGRSLDKLLTEKGRLDEATALTVMADVARGLREAHERGIVHRDIKPENILVVRCEGEDTSSSELRTTDCGLRTKLTDFGLARHVVQTESLNVTRAGAIMGTPLYMAPEQCSGSGSIDARTDVYALGATLFHLLAGRPPFVAATPLGVIALHCNEAPPPLQKLNPNLSDGICHIVAKALAKSPEARYADAGALLQDLERLLRGEPSSIAVHPRTPACDARQLLHYDFSWELESSPLQLWPHVSNTERLNRAAGLSAVQFTTQADPELGVRRFGAFRRAGLGVAWEEHPFEWVEGRRMGVLREYSQGPFEWLMSLVELAPRASGGTALTHRVRIKPRGLLGRTVAAVEVGVKGRRALDRIYRRIDSTLAGKAQGLLGSAWVDPFDEPAPLSGARRQRLDALLDRFGERGVDAGVVERFGDFLAHAPAQEVARIRPLGLARRLALDPEQVVAACLHGAREGLLMLLWDILCPVCRIPSEVKATLRELREHGRCEACNLDFELDFANSVEMIFRAHAEVRVTELATYCIGGPAHSPHVAAQARLAPGERLELDLALAEGAYRLRGPQLPFILDFQVQAGVPMRRFELDLSRGPAPEWPRTLQAGQQMLVLTNQEKHELVVRVERAAPRADALTAARASASAIFRELYPAEVLAPGQLISVATVTLLATELDGAADLYQQLGDARAFAVIHEHFRLLSDCIRRHGGALVKTVGDGVLATFDESVAAVRAGLDLPAALTEGKATRGLGLRIGIHRGAAMAATLNDHLDYFGTTANLAAQLPRLAGRGDMIVTQPVAADPQVAALLNQRDLAGAIVTAPLPGQLKGWVHRIRVG